jgi:hypothetical protein
MGTFAAVVRPSPDYSMEEPLVTSGTEEPVDSPPTPAAAVVGAERAVAEMASHVVGEAVWAPSVHNTQPWWFSVSSAGLSLYADPARQLAVADPAGREMLISCGAALFTARLALRAVGYIPRTQILPDPAQPLLVARLSWERGPAPTGYERLLHAQVRVRRTHRGAFDLLPLAPQLVAVLQERADRYGAMLHVVTDEGTRGALAEVVQEAERALELDSAHVRELAAWTSPPGSMRADGVPAGAYPARAERTFPYFPGRDFARGRGWGRPPLSTIPGRSAGVVCVLATRSDQPADWVNAGQALQSILLTSAAFGVAAALHSQPFELGWGRELTGSRTGPCPQLLLRLGTTIQTAAGVRRSPGSVLVTAGGVPIDPPLGTRADWTAAARGMRRMGRRSRAAGTLAPGS